MRAWKSFVEQDKFHHSDKNPMLNARGKELDDHNDIMLGADLLHAKAIQIASNKYQIYMPNPTKEGWVQSKSCAAAWE